MSGQPNGPRFSRNYRCQKDVRSTGGRGRQSSQRGLEVGEQKEEQLLLLREEEESLGAEN